MNKDEKKPKTPHLSVAAESAEQYRRWQKAAKADGRTLSSWARYVLDQQAQQQR